MERAGAGGVNRIAGRWISTTYLGEMAEHWVAIAGSAEPVKCFEMNPGIGAAAQEEVTLVIPPEQLLVVREDG